MPEEDNRGHSSYSVWLIFSFRAIEKILPALKGKSKYGWLPPFALCLLVLLASLGIGIYIDGYGIHPPTQYTGICAPPAQIKSGGCFLSQVIEVTKSGTATETTIQVPSGQVITQTQTTTTVTVTKG